MSISRGKERGRGEYPRTRPKSFFWCSVLHFSKKSERKFLAFFVKKMHTFICKKFANESEKIVVKEIRLYFQF